jgi:hypothetical protein
MRALWEITAGYADRDYIVYEDEHYTYGEIQAQVRSLAHLLHHRLRITQNLPRPRQQPPPSLAQPHPLPHPVKQHHPHLFLQYRNLPAQGRLRQMQPTRRPGHTQFLGHRHKIPQLMKFHPRPLPWVNHYRKT